VARLTRGLPQSSRTLTGPGDDCAVVRIPGPPLLQLFKADAMVEGIHFTRDMPAALVGRKALARAVSDIASMGGRPNEAMITLVLPPDLSWRWLQELYRGLKKAAKTWGVGLAGGETSSAPAGASVVISVALTGEVREDRVVRRDGAREGDVIAVTGRLGGSFASGRHLNFTPRLAEAQWLAEHYPPNAMMDLSDGLAKDLPRLAAASKTGWRLELDQIPCHAGATLEQAIGEGEDYELLLTFPDGCWETLSAAWRGRFPRLGLIKIGTVTPRLIREPELSGGWDHFAKA
jgi:thiamine-monophosphate kinase